MSTDDEMPQIMSVAIWYNGRAVFDGMSIAEYDIKRSIFTDNFQSMRYISCWRNKYAFSDESS